MKRISIPGMDILRDQKQACRRLETLLERGKIPHAILFTGITGSGKKSAADIFAMACNCESPSAKKRHKILQSGFGSIPCGNCRSCRKIASGSHPDISVIKPEGTVIKIKQVRQLCDDLSLKPYEAKWRFAVICDAHRMTAEAGNALLKVLEEPPPQTVLILIAPERADLAPTLVSRCQHLRFHPLSDDCIAEFLSLHRKVSRDEAETITRMAYGNLSRAIAMADSAERVDFGLKQRQHLVYTAGIHRPDSLPPAPLLLSFAFANGLSAEKERLAEVLEFLQTLMRDIAVLRWKPSYLINKDLTGQLQCVSQRISLKTLTDQNHWVQQAQKDLVSNMNPRLSMETLLLGIRKGFDEKSSRNPV